MQAVFMSENTQNTLPDNNHLPNFESALAELEVIVATMESEEFSLEQSLSAYKRGTELLQFCQKALAEVEQQVRVLNETNQLQIFTNTNE
jgi:exodeoxyribonuclease VII small subunit